MLQTSAAGGKMEPWQQLEFSPVLLTALSY